MKAAPSDAAPGAVTSASCAQSIVVNVVAFQVGWFACVLGAGHGVPWLGTATGLAIVAVHIARAPQPATEAKLIGIAVSIGTVWDSALAFPGWIDFTSGTLVRGMAPPWILALWALFATTLNVSLDWLKQRWLVAAVLGAVAGPLSYWGGAKLGAVIFVEPAPAIAALAVGWAAMMPALMAIARRFNGMRAAS